MRGVNEPKYPSIYRSISRICFDFFPNSITLKGVIVACPRSCVPNFSLDKKNNL
jgi:hypothetical protein